jgi:hypothetical protein
MKKDEPKPVAVVSDTAWGTCRKCGKRVEGTMKEIMAHKCEVA